MLPLPTGLARKQVGRARRHFDAGAPETAGGALAEAKNGRRVQRHPDDIFEHVAVAVPADAGARVVTREQDVDELVGSEARKSRRLFAQWKQPVGQRIRRPEARIIEIVAPAEALRLAVAQPSVEAERREFERH